MGIDYSEGSSVRMEMNTIPNFLSMVKMKGCYKPKEFAKILSQCTAENDITIPAYDVFEAINDGMNIARYE